MKKILSAFVFSLLSVAATSTIAAPMVELESAFETSSLYIRLSNDLTGIIKGRECDLCEIQMVKITPDTKLKINGLVVDLIKAKSLSGKPALVIFNLKTREVRLISH